MTKLVSDDAFIAAWHKGGCSPIGISKIIGLPIRNVYKRRAQLLKKGIELPTIDSMGRDSPYMQVGQKFERQRSYEIKNGTVIVFSDCHFYPDHTETALNALVTLIKELKPQAVFCGGDVLDGTQIGHFDPTRGWHQPPSLKEQLDCVTENMHTIAQAAGKRAILAQTLGNHDCRLSRYLAVNARHVEDLPGTRLEDYIPQWPLSWTIRLNGNTVIRHRNLAGMLHLQALKAGCHYVHGHLHKLNCHAVPTYNGFNYSVDCGSFAEPSSDAFDYSEDGPPHVQGFAVLTYKDSQLLWPEFCYVRGKSAYFRGSVV